MLMDLYMDRNKAIFLDLQMKLEQNLSRHGYENNGLHCKMFL